MKILMHKFGYLGLLAIVLCSACATTETIISKPKVELTGVELHKVDFGSQTFLLRFEVSNPNGFPLPVESVRYRILFDEQNFAGGETQANFTIPARGEGAFTLSVETDFLGSATQIASLLRGGIPEHVVYELRGSLAIDIPLVRPLAFTNSGVIPIEKQPF